MACTAERRKAEQKLGPIYPKSTPNDGQPTRLTIEVVDPPDVEPPHE